MVAGRLAPRDALDYERVGRNVTTRVTAVRRCRVPESWPRRAASGCYFLGTCARRRAFSARAARTSPPRQTKRLRCVPRWSKPHALVARSVSSRHHRCSQLALLQFLR